MDKAGMAPAADSTPAICECPLFIYFLPVQFIFSPYSNGWHTFRPGVSVVGKGSLIQPSLALQRSYPERVLRILIWLAQVEGLY
jgi:hypothetical protein